MGAGERWRLLRHDLRVNARDFLLASLGTVIGVVALVVVVALGLGLHRVVASDVRGRGLLEVTRQSRDVGLWAFRLELSARGFGDDEIASLEAVDGVEAVFPKAVLKVPAIARGGESFLGMSFVTELLVEGLDPAAVGGEAGTRFVPPDPAEIPAGPCPSAGCGPHAYCAPAEGFAPPTCRPFIPALISPQLVALYNGAVRHAYDLPKLDPAAAVGLGCELVAGASTLHRAPTRNRAHERLRLAGVDEMAMKIGVSLPLEEVLRLNRECGAETAGRPYSSALLRLADPDDIARVMEAVRRIGFEAVDEGDARAARLVALVTLLASFGGVLLVALSSLHLMHVFLLHVNAREAEIGLFRALGARLGDIRRLILAEATTVGFAAGVVGAALGWLLTTVAERMIAGALPALSAWPMPIFVVPLWLPLAAVVLAVLGAAAGALLPAYRAARKDPAQSLRGV